MIRIAVVGLGQIGGSIVLALRRSNWRQYEITGIDTSVKRRRLLKEHLKRSSSEWRDAADAEVVLICLHYEQTKQFLSQKNSNQLLLDVCSGKAKLVRYANKKKLRFIGGHPMAGNEFAGEKGWRDSLFENTPFFLCRSVAATQKDVALTKRIVRDLGARPVEVDPKTHDRYVAITSHFPAVLSKLLSSMAKDVPMHFQGPGFRSMTRLAKTPPDLMRTFLQSNAEEILRNARTVNKLLQQWIRATRK